MTNPNIKYQAQGAYFNNMDDLRFVGAIEKALTFFDSINEWQDFIGFLSRILKILQQHKSTDIPKKIILSKRLAQTLNPALPAGAHQKALEVYSLIFENTLFNKTGSILN